MRAFFWAGIPVALAAVAPDVAAQQYPTRPVRFIIPFAPGGGADLVARALGQKLFEAWGTSVIIDNRPGASAGIAAEITARAPADGYTVFQINIANAIAVSINKNMSYDPLKDFAAVTQLAQTPFVLMGHPSVKAQNIKELIALAKANPGGLNYSSSGPGGPSHLLGELFKTMAGVNIVHVPYQSVAPAMNDLIPGRIQLMFVIPALAVPNAASGKLRAYGISSPQRSILAPQVPTVAESGLPGFEGGAWYGVVVPAKTPQPVVNKLHADMTKILKVPEMRDRLAEQGVEVVASTPDEFTQFMKSEIAKFTKLAQTVKLD